MPTLQVVHGDGTLSGGNQTLETPSPKQARDTLVVSSVPEKASGQQLVVWSRDGKHIEARYFRPLDAGFRAAPATGPAPLTVVFTDTTSPLDKADRWAWDFGDGHLIVAQQHPQHSYSAPGVYSVTLTVSDSRSGESESLLLPAAITVTEATIQERTITYTYDSLSRLTAADYSTGEAFEYTYDAVGNRIIITSTTPLSGTVITTHTFDAANRLTARTVSDGRAYTYTWSHRGQMLAEYTGGVPVRTFTYDGAGRMIRARVFTQTTEFVYNGLGDRVAVHVDGYGATTYVLDYAAGNRILVETMPTSTVSYLYGHDCLGEFRNDVPLYYLPDAEGYVRQGVDADGAVVSAWLFDPDGVLLEGPDGPVSHLVCGGVYDWSTGLLYKGGRYFDPNLGVWLVLLPLAVIQGWPGRKRRKGGHPWVLLVGVGLLIIGTLMGCGKCDNCAPTTTPTECIIEPVELRVKFVFFPGSSDYDTAPSGTPTKDIHLAQANAILNPYGVYIAEALPSLKLNASETSLLTPFDPAYYLNSDLEFNTVGKISTLAETFGGQSEITVYYVKQIDFEVATFGGYTDRAGPDNNWRPSILLSNEIPNRTFPHEIGHACGLEHPGTSDANNLMTPSDCGGTGTDLTENQAIRLRAGAEMLQRYLWQAKDENFIY